MEIYERIRELRKNYLHLNQTEFGEKLGVSRSVIKNIELNTLVRPEQKLSLYKLICSEFNVNEDWLLNGNEPMFKTDTFNLDEFMKQKGATELELELVRTYFELDPETRRAVLEHFKNKFTGSAQKKENDETDLSNKTIEELEEEYKKTILHSASKTTYPVSNITDGIEKRNKAQF